MNGLVFYIGLGLGLALAAGVRPFLPALLAGALGSGSALGVGFSHSNFAFLQADWWLLAVTVALLVAWLLQLRLGVERFEGGPGGAAVAGLGVGLGAVLFAGTLGQHGDASWPGLLAGALAALLAQAAVRPLLARARARLAGGGGSSSRSAAGDRGARGDSDRGAREALTIYADVTALVIAALTCLLHPLGYLALVPFAWLAVSTRRRAGEKYAGLRTLRR
jgi:hypothetical protein